MHCLKHNSRFWNHDTNDYTKVIYSFFFKKKKDITKVRFMKEANDRYTFTLLNGLINPSFSKGHKVNSIFKVIDVTSSILHSTTD